MQMKASKWILRGVIAAVFLGFGVLFSIFVTLVLIPALYVIVEDFKCIGHRLRPSVSAG
jgi:hypothetical protein